MNNKLPEIRIRCLSARGRRACRKLEKLTDFVCRRFGLNRAQISITIGDEAIIKKLNKEFFDKNTTTDVISFDLSERGETQKVFDIIVNADEAVMQAKKRKHTTGTELALYLVHGMLHNLGYNDDTPAAAAKMHRAEDDILTRAGFGAVYNSSIKRF